MPDLKLLQQKFAEYKVYDLKYMATFKQTYHNVIFPMENPYDGKLIIYKADDSPPNS